MANTISAEDLKKKIDNKEDFYLVDVLSENSYEAKHVPGAANIPNSPDFLSRFEKEIGAPKEADIVVYCSSNTCQASVQATETLEEAGYTNVTHFAGGLAGWQDAGYEFKGQEG